MIAQKESREQIREAHIEVDYRLCFSCGACVAMCPPDSIFLTNLHLTIDDATCTRCGRCVPACPVHALSLRQ